MNEFTLNFICFAIAIVGWIITIRIGDERGASRWITVLGGALCWPLALLIVLLFFKKPVDNE